MQARNAAAKPGRVANKVAKQPMFCFETAIKMFFFSSFVYTDYNAVSKVGARQAGTTLCQGVLGTGCAPLPWILIRSSLRAWVARDLRHVQQLHVGRCLTEALSYCAQPWLRLHSIA